MRCLQKYRRNDAGQTLTLDFLYPWTSPARIRIYSSLIYPQHIQKDTDKKAFAACANAQRDTQISAE